MRPRPFYWQVDLKKSYDLAWIGPSFKSVGLSIAMQSAEALMIPIFTRLWTIRETFIPAIKSHMINGSFRYIRMNDYSVYDGVHNKEAGWEVGVYEISVYGYASKSTIKNTSSITQATKTILLASETASKMTTITFRFVVAYCHGRRRNNSSMGRKENEVAVGVSIMAGCSNVSEFSKDRSSHYHVSI